MKGVPGLVLSAVDGLGHQPLLDPAHAHDRPVAQRPERCRDEPGERGQRLQQRHRHERDAQGDDRRRDEGDERIHVDPVLVVVPSVAPRRVQVPQVDARALEVEVVDDEDSEEGTQKRAQGAQEVGDGGRTPVEVPRRHHDRGDDGDDPAHPEGDPLGIDIGQVEGRRNEVGDDIHPDGGHDEPEAHHVEDDVVVDQGQQLARVVDGHSVDLDGRRRAQDRRHGEGGPDHMGVGSDGLRAGASRMQPRGSFRLLGGRGADMHRRPRCLPSVQVWDWMFMPVPSRPRRSTR